jgi:hypothetical protein
MHRFSLCYQGVCYSGVDRWERNVLPGFINNLIVAKFTLPDKAKMHLWVEKSPEND